MGFGVGRKAVKAKGGLPQSHLLTLGQLLYWSDILNLSALCPLPDKAELRWIPYIIKRRFERIFDLHWIVCSIINTSG